MPAIRTKTKIAASLTMGLALFLCLLNNPAFAANIKPITGIVTPASGGSVFNEVVTFTSTFSDGNGWTNINAASLLINTTSSTKSKCFYGMYNQNTNKIYIRNDADTAWLGGYAPGSASVIENSYVKLVCSNTTVFGSGNSLTVKWNIIFKSSFLGSKNTYLYVSDDSGAYQGWTQKGTWIIAANTTPVICTFTPANNSTFTEGDIVSIYVCAIDPVIDPLEFQVVIDGAIVNPWFSSVSGCNCSSTNGAAITYNWQTSSSNSGPHKIKIDVRDNKVAPVSKETNVFIYRKPLGPPQ